MGISTATADSWQLIYASDLYGELKPCGCSDKGNLGGVLRRASKLEALAAENTNTVVVSAGDILSGLDEQGRIKSKYILQAYAELGIDALLAGERELRFATEVLHKHPLPWVLSNAGKASGFPRKQIKKLGNGKRVIILGVLQQTLTGLELDEPAAAILRELKEVRLDKNDTIVLLVHGDKAYAERFAALNQIDVIVRGHLDGPVKQAVDSRMISPVILSAGHRGQRLGIAEFSFTEPIRMLNNRIISLAKDIPDHPRLSSLYQRYDDEVTRWYRNKSQQMKRSARKDSDYASHQLCARCHTREAKSWQGTRHAHAMLSLQSAGKVQDPECLLCHTTGMEREGGFVAHKLTPQLENVQCEACHGAARRHAEYPRRYRPQNGFTACKSCHSKENSPDFDMRRYWMQIAHSKSSPIPLHRQGISAIVGSYELVDETQSVVDKTEIEVVEFFNFYCSRCYVLNANWKSVTEGQREPLSHKEIPIIIGEAQEPWATLAWIVAREHGLEDKVKDALFAARFEQKVDLSDKRAVVNVMQRFGINTQVEEAINDTSSKAWREYELAQAEKDEWDVHETPMVLINKKLRVTPKHSAENTNLMLENLQEILLDIQCRRTGACD